MSNNTKYLIIAAVVIAAGYFLWKKYSLVKKVA